jgi:hypothetical protein
VAGAGSSSAASAAPTLNEKKPPDEVERRRPSWLPCRPRAAVPQRSASGTALRNRRFLRATCRKDDVMNHPILMLASLALLLWIPSSANAGPCTTEIEMVTKSLSAADAGSGPTLSPGTTRTQAPSSSGQHPPTETMRRETEGKATSDQDVRRQTQGQPTAAEQGRRGAATNDKMAEVDPPTCAGSRQSRQRI